MVTSSGSSDLPPADRPPEGLDAAVYAELKRIAHHHLRARSSGATLSTTDLLHDAYLKFGAPGSGRWDSRAHFFGAASRAIRQVLVDYARNRQALKRGGGAADVTLDEGDAVLDGQIDEVVAIDDALGRLRAVDERLARVVELRFFAGLGDEDIAALLEVTARTVRRDWTKARLFLERELTDR